MYSKLLLGFRPSAALSSVSATISGTKDCDGATVGTSCVNFLAGLS